MTAPSYTNDLTDISTAESTTGWAEPSDGAWDDGGGPTADSDYPYIQGTVAITQQATKATIASLLFDYGSGMTLPTDGAYLVWQDFASSTGLDTYANGGMAVMVGSSLGDFYAWDVGGVDFGSYPYGGWMNHAVNTTVGSNDTVGSPTTTEQFIGAAVRPLVAIGKGNPHSVDVIRYGRCSSIFEYGDVSNGYCTFDGYATENDYNDATNGYHRWGLIQAIAGGYLFKGKMTLGTATNAVDFRDSNVKILIDGTPKVTSGFNRIEIVNASSRVDWTNVSIEALGAISRGNFEAVDNADINKVSCSFTDMGTFIYQSNSDLDVITYRRCNLVTLGGAPFTTCIFDKTNDSTKAALAATVAEAALITKSEFISSGTKYGLEITGAAGDFTLTDVTWTGYASSDGSTGNEAIHITATTGTFNITISGGTTPSIHSAGATVNIIAGAVTTLVTAKDADTKVAIEGVAVTVKAAATGPLPFEASVTITRVGDVATVAHTGHGLATNQKVEIEGADQNEYNRIKAITKIDADSYSFPVSGSPTTPATGTITSTGIIIDGKTNASGQISDTRVFSSNQDFTGSARKGTHSPVYVGQDLAGTVDKDSGISISLLMIND